MKKAKKSKLAKARDNPASRYWLNRADRAWSLAVRARAGNKCEVCDATEHLQAHHLIDRSYKPTRHELDNGVCLCPSCHKYAPLRSAHKGTVLFHHWLELTRPATKLQVIRWALDALALQKTGTTPPKPNYTRAALVLESELERMKKEAKCGK